MKKLFLLSISLYSTFTFAQDPYLNNTLVNTSDLRGTSRFVAMGGAMGALGADISTISANPAGLAMFTKNDMSFTAGASWLGNNSARGMASGTQGHFDQIGAIASFKGNGSFRNINLAVNYQKKIDYSNCFYGETATLASWADQLDALAGEAYDNRGYLYGRPDTYYSTLYGLADGCGLFNDGIVKSPNDLNSTLSVTRGSLSACDINLSANVDNRYFFGVTLGIDNMDFRRGTDYWEQRTDASGDIHDFGYVNEQTITGTGVNLKFGAIVRPIETSPFRIGVAVETPTWYRLKYVDDQSLTTKYYWDEKQQQLVYDPASGVYYTHYVYDLSDSYINYLEYRLNTPWKVRAQMGSTISNNFAWGVEYEFANYPGTTMRYPSEYGGTNIDEDFKFMTETMLLPQHTLRAGVEFKPISGLSLRLGYNYITSTTGNDSYWDPYYSDNSLSYPTGVDYMNLSDTHIIACGAGYRYKSFYLDLAYKYRNQRADYYAFDSFYSNVDMSPIPVDLSRHSLTATIGVKF